MLLQLQLSYGSALTPSPLPETVLALLFTSTDHLLLGLLLVSGYTYAGNLGRDRTWASTTGLQLSWWSTSSIVFSPSSHPLLQQTPGHSSAPKRLNAHTGAMDCVHLHLSCRCRQVIQANTHCHGRVHFTCTVAVKWSSSLCCSLTFGCSIIYLF